MVHQYVTKDTLNEVREKAENGDAIAQYELGMSYIDGMVVDKNIEEGLKWVTLSAQQNHDCAQVSLGMFYYYGGDGTRDLNKAIYWFNRAAALGSREGQLRLSQCYSYDLFDENPEYYAKEAVRWLVTAAKTGCAAACIVYNELYHQGKVRWDRDIAKTLTKILRSHECDGCEILSKTMKCPIG